MRSFRHQILVALVLLCAGNAFAVESPVDGSGSDAPLADVAVVSQNYTVGYLWQQGATGAYYGPFVDADFRQKLYQELTAQVDARIYKGASSDPAAQIELETAEASYVGPWISLSGGRRDLGAFLSPGSYFGAYSTMGERQLDSVLLTFPFRFFADIPDASAQIEAPYNALSVLYVPNLFEADQSSYTGAQGVVLGQVRTKFKVLGVGVDLGLDYSEGVGDYFQYSSIQPGGSAEGTVAFNWAGWNLWGDYGIQSIPLFLSTQVVAAGLSVDIAKYTFKMLDLVDVEGQLPLGIADPANPFTGGDPQEPALGQTPQLVWFAQVKKAWGPKTPNQPMRLFYGGAITNSVDDYTLARIGQGTLNVPVNGGFGLGPMVEGVPLRAAKYGTYAGIVYAGYQF